jgi:hypothetical protein
MAHRRTFAFLYLPALLLALTACSAEVAATTPPPAAKDGWLTLQLITPRTDDGAVQFNVTGPAIDSVSVVTYNGFATVNAGAANLVVTGQVGNGDVARVHVPDVSLAAAYHATVSAAAARQTYALQPLDGYRAVLVR